MNWQQLRLFMTIGLMITFTFNVVYGQVEEQEENVIERYGGDSGVLTRMIDCDGYSRSGNFENATNKAECDRMMLDISKLCMSGYMSFVCTALEDPSADVVGNYIIRENLFTTLQEEVNKEKRN